MENLLVPLRGRVVQSLALEILAVGRQLLHVNRLDALMVAAFTLVGSLVVRRRFDYRDRGLL